MHSNRNIVLWLATLLLFPFFPVAAQQNVSAVEELKTRLEQVQAQKPVEALQLRIKIIDEALAEKGIAEDVKRFAQDQRAAFVMSLSRAGAAVDPKEMQEAIRTLENLEFASDADNTAKLFTKEMILQGYLDLKQWDALERQLEEFPDSSEFANAYVHYKIATLKGRNKDREAIAQELMKDGSNPNRPHIAKAALKMAGLRYAQLTSNSELSQKALAQYQESFPEDPFLPEFAKLVQTVQKQNALGENNNSTKTPSALQPSAIPASAPASQPLGAEITREDLKVAKEAQVELKAGNIDSAISLLNGAIAQQDKLTPEGKCKTLFFKDTIARIYMTKGENDRALGLFEENLIEINRTENDLKSISLEGFPTDVYLRWTTIDAMATICRQQGNYDQAKTHVMTLLAYANKLGAPLQEKEDAGTLAGSESSILSFLRWQSYFVRWDLAHPTEKYRARPSDEMFGLIRYERFPISESLPASMPASAPMPATP